MLAGVRGCVDSLLLVMLAVAHNTPVFRGDVAEVQVLGLHVVDDLVLSASLPDDLVHAEEELVGPALGLRLSGLEGRGDALVLGGEALHDRLVQPHVGRVVDGEDGALQADVVLQAVRAGLLRDGGGARLPLHHRLHDIIEFTPQVVAGGRGEVLLDQLVRVGADVPLVDQGAVRVGDDLLTFDLVELFGQALLQESRGRRRGRHGMHHGGLGRGAGRNPSRWSSRWPSR